MATMLFFVSFVFGAGISAMAQSITVSGTVTNSQTGGGEIGVVVSIKGDNKTATMTDNSGKYSITVPEKNSVLVFSSLGFRTEEVEINGRAVINVSLVEEAEVLNDVLIIGYGSQKRQFVVGSVSQVNSSELLISPSPNAQNMLTGKLSGLTTIQSYGTPGDDSATLLVRGKSTFNSSSPLILVDGVERQMNFLNPNDIATISILKDAATAAIYGVKGANGVILVTTKSGSEGKATISYDGSVSFEYNAVIPEVLNADEYIYWHNLARTMDNQTPYWTDEVLSKLNDLGVLGETDWFKKIFDTFGVTQQHSVSASGGTEKFKYYASFGYMNQDGILKNCTYDRYNFRANIDAKLAKGLRLAMNVSGSYSNRNRPGLSLDIQYDFNPIQWAFYALPIFKETYNGLPFGYRKSGGTYVYNPEAAIESGYQTQQTWRAEVRSTLEYDFTGVKALQGLKASFFFAYNFAQTLDRKYLESYYEYYYDPDRQDIGMVRSPGISENNFNKSQSTGLNYTIRPQLSYEREFNNKHQVSALFLFEAYKSYNDTMTGYKKGYYTDYPVDISIGLTNDSPYVSGSFKHAGMASFAGRVDYVYDKKYIIEGTLRADGSYKFAPKNRWGYFPSVALGWVMSEENFIKNKASVINYLKLRGSYGVLGSDDTDDYLYLQTYSTTSPNYSYVIDGTSRSAFYTTSYVYDDLTWSRTHCLDVGVEARLFNNRFSFEFDWFYKLTTRILESDSTGTYAPSLGGNNPVWLNSGRVDNRGFDMTIGWTDAFSNGWSYGFTGILSWARNKLLSRRLSDDNPSYRARLGEPMGQIYGFHATGLFQTQEQLDNYTTAPSGTTMLGAIMYEDINGDGIISSAYDYVKIGRSSTPEMTFSLNMEVGWKNLKLTMLWQGATLCNYTLNGTYNNGNLDNTMYTRPFYSGGNALRYIVEDSWREDNRDARYPRLSATGNANNAWSSTWWVVDGSYLRLKNVQLSYTIPSSTLNHKMERIMVYLSGTNLLTVSGFKYMDPENPGVNNGYYPQQASFSVGLNLTF